MPTTDPQEPFETFTPDGQRLGIAPRGEVHRQGLWHRSAHVFLYDSNGRMCLQQRSHAKDLYAGAWDYSVGEHLQPGESYLAAALRGLQEELSISLTTLEPLGEPTPSEFTTADGSAIDREFQQAYQGTLDHSDNWRIEVDTTEVAQVRWLNKNALAQFIAANQSTCTPWLLRDIERFGLAK